MPNIYFIQYLFPDGRKKLVRIERPEPVVAKADAIIRNGFRFEIENASGVIHMTISDDDQDYASRICANGPDVPVTVDYIILNFNIAEAIKQRKEGTC